MSLSLASSTAAPTAATPVPNYGDYTDSTIQKSLYTTLYYCVESSIVYGVQVVAGSNPVAPTLSFVQASVPALARS